MKECNYCKKRATRNYQKVWVVWKVMKDGGYSKEFEYKGCDIEEPTGEDNVHACDKCGDRFERGEI